MKHITIILAFLMMLSSPVIAEEKEELCQLTVLPHKQRWPVESFEGFLELALSIPEIEASEQDLAADNKKGLFRGGQAFIDGLIYYDYYYNDTEAAVVEWTTSNNPTAKCLLTKLEQLILIGRQQFENLQKLEINEELDRKKYKIEMEVRDIIQAAVDAELNAYKAKYDKREEANAEVNAALSAAEMSDKVAGFREMLALARKENIHAIKLVILMYLEGQGTIQNYVEAIKWAKVGADRGDVETIAQLGMMYADGIGVTQDYKEAKKLFYSAAQQGSASAQGGLGLLYNQGLGASKDHVKAHMLV